jgi:PAS domain S-box-containing protein
VIVAEEDFGRILAVNSAACRLFGYERAELLAGTARLWVTDDEVAAHVYEQLRPLGASVRAEATVRRKDGTLVRIGYRSTRTRVAGIDFLLTITDPIAEATPVD